MNGSEVRDKVILTTIAEELFGPCAQGPKFDWKSGKVKTSELTGPLVASEDSEEILKLNPLKRYGVGVLYPLDDLTIIDEDIDSSTTTELTESEKESIESMSLSKQVKLNSTDDGHDFDISLTNTRLPSSVGVSFIFDETQCSNLSIAVTGSFYVPFSVTDDKNYVHNWWKREPISIEYHLDLNKYNGKLKIPLKDQTNDPRLSEFFIEGIIRKYSDKAIATIVLVNRKNLAISGKQSYKDKNASSLFQSKLSVKTIDDRKSEIWAILPYPSQPINSFDDLSNDEKSNELLYRNAQSFGKGHGTAVDWNAKAYEDVSAVSEIYTNALPTFETPSITAEVNNGSESIEISMELLSKIEDGSEGELQLEKLITWYEKWIDDLENEKQQITHIDEAIKLQLIEQANTHIFKCRKAHQRIKDGFERLGNDYNVKKAFQLTNLAMLNQQKRAPKEIRKASLIEGEIQFRSSFTENATAKGLWRPFQIGFLLMCISGAAEPEHEDHELVDLIWFPTGGGKTEAYLGLAAFTMLHNRLSYGVASSGVQVLMRYTLRLLTAQQLQRAATLVCCLEVIRRENKIDGGEFSIGLWVGSKNTPNKRSDARIKFNKLVRDIPRKGEIENPFLLDRCPYCGSQMGVAGSDKKFLAGYKKDRINKTVVFKCEDHSCSFTNGIPVIVIDEDIYEKKPSIVIATVDKFAMLAWEPRIRNLFGIGDEGVRECLPPQLIIQDELHLITGPLGTMVGHYEPLIEKLCSYTTDSDFFVRPKIVCATATTKGYEDQVKGIYGRNNTDIFPPPGLIAEDSFFSKYERDSSENLKPGRKYLGVCAPGLGSILTAQVRTHSAMLFSSNRVELNSRDPWITLLSFYNSIRELGGALTLFQADINSYILELKRRYPKFLLPRFLNGGMELTSRLKDDEIPAAITLLERGLKHEVITENFFNSLHNELETFRNDHAESKTTLDPLLTALKSKKHLNVEDYIMLDNFKVVCKNNNWEFPKTFSTIFNLLQGRNVTPFCLASSIIEVGVDIDRLSLMSIVGQPKTTAQYIQVSGRVGRKPTERPGLVTIIYNNAKPRDKSHYEDFRSYHQRLYAQVEPSSVTPYSRPAIERGFSALMIAHARQLTPINTQPKELRVSHFDEWFSHLLKMRKDTIQEDELKDLHNYYEKRFKNSWNQRGVKSETWGHLKPDAEPLESDVICPLGSTARKRHQFECPTSMRNVDGESVVWISPRAYEAPEDDSYFEDY